MIENNEMLLDPRPDDSLRIKNVYFVAESWARA